MTPLPETLCPPVPAEAPSALPAVMHEDVCSHRERLLVGRLPGSGKAALARALIPLDVMGGIAECAGALLLHAAVGEMVTVGVRRGPPGHLSVYALDAEGWDGAPPWSAPLRDLRTPQGEFLPASEITERLRKRLSLPALALLGSLVEAARHGLLPDLEDGWSAAGAGCADLITESASLAPLTGATLAAIAALHEATLDGRRAAKIMECVQQEWLGWPLGLGEAQAVLSSVSIALHQFRSDALTFAGNLEIPQPWEIIGMDCGAEAADARVTNRRVRAAAGMGRLLVQRIKSHEEEDAETWNGHLSGLSVTDYVERYRDRLPTKMKGREFLDRFGDPGDPLAPIEPAYLYKIRSRSEHMIYEHQRATHFAELIARGTRKNDPGEFAEAGELMYASHWSYGQRCGLGSVETDYLVNLLRACKVAQDIFGAKVCGRGCGGLVAVLLRSSTKSQGALESVCAAYQQKMKRAPRVLRGATRDAAALAPVIV